MTIKVVGAIISCWSLVVFRLAFDDMTHIHYVCINIYSTGSDARIKGLNEE